MKKQAGFTLIELIMVIVILGILSAFALPRFADLSGNAETAAVEGARASVASSNAIVHASALANTSTGQNDTVDLEGQTVNTAWGYPAAASIAAAATLDASEFSVGTIQTQVENTLPTLDVPAIVIITRAGANPGDDCFTFQEATSAASSVVGQMGNWTDTDSSNTVNAGDTCS